MIAYNDQTDNNSGINPAYSFSPAAMVTSPYVPVPSNMPAGPTGPGGAQAGPTLPALPAVSTSVMDSTTGQYFIIAAVGFFIYFLWKHT